MISQSMSDILAASYVGREYNPMHYLSNILKWFKRELSPAPYIKSPYKAGQSVMVRVEVNPSQPQWMEALVTGIESRQQHDYTLVTGVSAGCKGRKYSVCAKYEGVDIKPINKIKRKDATYT